MEVRAARLDDLPALTDIYNHYVETTDATFDERPAALEERRAWFERFAEVGPYRLLVATDGARLLGHASSGRYRDHPAFRETVEASVYLAPDARGRGVGSALYARLFELLRGEPVRCVVAGVALPNPASVALHEKHGFRRVGVFEEYAVKRGRYVSSLWLQKLLDGSRPLTATPGCPGAG